MGFLFLLANWLRAFAFVEPQANGGRWPVRIPLFTARQSYVRKTGEISRHGVPCYTDYGTIELDCSQLEISAAADGLVLFAIEIA